MIRKILKTTLSCLVISSTVGAWAQETENHTVGTFPEPQEVTTREEQKIHMGLNLGLNTPSGGYENSLGMAVDVGYQPYIPYGIGAELFTTEMDDDDKKHDDQRIGLLGRGTYNFGGELPVIRHSFVGLGAGPVLTGRTWDVGVAPVIGFDHPLNMVEGGELSIGANVKYMYTTSATADGFMTSAAVKYWY